MLPDILGVTMQNCYLKKGRKKKHRAKACFKSSAKAKHQ